MKSEMVNLLVYFGILLGLFSAQDIARKDNRKNIAKILAIAMIIFILAMVPEVISIWKQVFP